MTTVGHIILNVIDDALAFIEGARRRTVLRRFLHDHPDVRWSIWTDGTD